MGLWPWQARKGDERVIDALAAEKAAHSELLGVVAELETLVARLNQLPEVQAARRGKTGATGARGQQGQRGERGEPGREGPPGRDGDTT
jgi:hypothetical protein